MNDIFKYKGVFPVVPTVFNDNGGLDLDGQLSAVDFMIDAGSDGLCILANYSEQFAISDEERGVLTNCILEHVEDRVPVIVTTSHFSTDITIKRCIEAQELGAAMVMIMPPFFGATIRCSEQLVYEYFTKISDAISIPIMIQDAPMSGTQLSVDFLIKMAKEIKQISYFKIEVSQAASKLRSLIRQGGDAIIGPWDGEEGITLLSDLNAGATGAMSGGGYPDGIKEIYQNYAQGGYEKGLIAYQKWLPLINAENRQGGIASAKILMKAGGIINSDYMRHPQRIVDVETSHELITLAKKVNALVLRYK